MQREAAEGESKNIIGLGGQVHGTSVEGVPTVVREPDQGRGDILHEHERDGPSPEPPADAVIVPDPQPESRVLERGAAADDDGWTNDGGSQTAGLGDRADLRLGGDLAARIGSPDLGLGVRGDVIVDDLTGRSPETSYSVGIRDSK